MDINRKLELAKLHVVSITRHDDVDMGVRSAALDALGKLIEDERAAMKDRLDQSIEAALTPPAVVEARPETDPPASKKAKAK